MQPAHRREVDLMATASRADLFAYSLDNLKHRQLRSWLTVLGIVVGIAAVVTLISISLGLAKSIDDQLSQFGSKTIAVVPGDINKQMSFTGGSGRPPALGKLFTTDVDRIKRIDGVEYISGAISITSGMSFKNKDISVGISGIEPNIFKQTQVLDIASGRFLTDTDRGGVVIGDGLANEIFNKDKVLVGSVVRFGTENQEFRVVGVLKKGGGASGSAIDSSVFMHIDDARKLAGDSIAKNEVSAIRLTVKDGTSVNDVADKINTELLSAHKVKEDDKDFSVVTSEFIMKQVGQITALLSIFLGGIASISLVVGGVGIANTMFMAVVERTKEIGIMKAVGASNGAILEAFLIESGLIGLGGGIIGIIIGSFFAFIVSFFGIPFVMPLELVLGTAAFSLLVGLASGYVPARNAAKLQPVEALRFE
jgi:putative ABC transport system permease protein